MPSRFGLVLPLILLFSASLMCQRTGGGRTGGGAGRTGGTVNRGAASPADRPAPINTGADQTNYHHADDEPRVEFKSDTVLVLVPAVVTDKSGNHIHGLSRDDFQVFEKGKEQKITTFEEIETAKAPLVKRSTSGEFSNLAATIDSPCAVTVIVLDTVNTPFLDQAYGRKQIIRYLAENVNSDQVSGLVAITGRGLKAIHPLTSDPKALVNALKKLNGEIPALQGTDVDTQAEAASIDVFAPHAIVPVGPDSDPEQALQDFVLHGDATIARMQQDRAIEITMRGFLDIAWSLSGIPGRKSLIWATSGFPFYIDQPSAVPVGYLAQLYEQAMQALNDAQISVYPVDIRGLVNYSLSVDVGYAPRGARNLSGSAYANSLSARAWLHSSTLDTLRDFAEMTGGRAFYNSNDIAGGVRRAVDDSSSYYLLGYYLDTRNTKSGWRPLKVKARKHDVDVRARTGFFVTNATVNPELNHQADMQIAVASPFDSTGVPLTLRWLHPSTGGDRKKADYSLNLPGNSITVAKGERPGFDLDVAAVAIKNGVAADSTSQRFHGNPSAETLAKIRSNGLVYRNAIELPPGEYTVRFVVRDNLSGKVGTVSAPLTVN